MNTSVNVPVTPEVLSLLTSLAKKRKISLEELLQDLLEFAMDDLEDRVLSAIAEERDKGNPKTIPDEEVW